MSSLSLALFALLWLVTVNVKGIVATGEFNFLLTINLQPILGEPRFLRGGILLGVLSFIALIHILLICGLKYVSLHPVTTVSGH
jgi:hypothetical protein